jgi:hypothetical protein
MQKPKFRKKNVLGHHGVKAKPKDEKTEERPSKYEAYQIDASNDSKTKTGLEPE